MSARAPPALPVDPVAALQCLDAAGAVPYPLVPLSVSEFEQASLRVHVSDPATVLVCSSGLVVAALPIQHARFMRFKCLELWGRRTRPLPGPFTSERPKCAPTRFWEADVAATVAAWCVLSPASIRNPPPSFRGDSHTFMDYCHHYEAPLLRGALLPARPGPLPLLSPATSAYTNVEHLGSPLHAAAFDVLHHPQALTFANSIRVGFHLHFAAPSSARGAPDFHSSTRVQVPGTEAAVEVELASGAFLPVPQCCPTPLRFAPLFAVPKSETTARLVSDFSFGGPTSLNSVTHVGSIPRSRLAKFPDVIARLQHMKRACPGRRVVMAKLDVTRAYRCLGLPVRDMFATAHNLREGPVVNARVMIGARTGGDAMSPGVSMSVDLLNAMGIAAFSFIDDVLIMVYEDLMPAALAAALGIWKAMGFPLNVSKFEAEGRPTTRIVFLGLLLDSEAMTLSVPEQYRAKLVTRVLSLLSTSKSVCPRMLASVAGSLQSVAAVVPFGRVFLHNLYPRGGITPALSVMEADLVWWLEVLRSEQLEMSFSNDLSLRRVLRVASDASGSGFGAVCPELVSFFSGCWSPDVRRASTTAQWECLMALYVLSVYGPVLPPGSILHLFSDSSATVSVMSRQKCADPTLFSILRCVSLLQLRLGVNLQVSHIPGVVNSLADYASRFDRMPASSSLARVHLRMPLLQLGNSLLLRLLSAPSLEAVLTELRPPCSASTARTASGHLLPLCPLISSSSRLPMESYGADFSMCAPTSSPIAQ